MQQIQLPPLEEGEIHVCSIADHRGELTHLILMPGENEGASQPDQQAWAESGGGDLPTLTEQALMREFCPEEFKAAAYWSKRNDGDGWAWFTYFGDGCQSCSDEYAKLRARRVRRIKN